jgi:hypothetical protein
MMNPTNMTDQRTAKGLIMIMISEVLICCTPFAYYLILSSPACLYMLISRFLRHFVKFLPGAINGAKAGACQQSVPHDALDLARGPGALHIANQIVDLGLLRHSALQDANGLSLCIEERE